MALQFYELLGDDDRRFSPYCWRIRMALAHKGLDAEIIPCRFTDKAALAFSGQERVPVLRHGDVSVADSWDIACYLEETWPDRPSLFGGDVGRGEARFINEWIPALSSPVLKTVIKDIYDHSHPDDRTYFRESREKRLGRTLEELDIERETHRGEIEANMAPLRYLLAKQPFICGNAPAYGDYIVFGMFQWVRSISPMRLVEPGNAVHDWRRRMLDLHDGLARSVTAYPE